LVLFGRHGRVFAHPDDTLIAEWACDVSPLPRWSFESTTPAFRFRAVLTDDTNVDVVLAEV
jgi:hypothetical protein